MSTSFQIKNWKLMLLGLIITALFTKLGCWQLARAQEKKALITSFQQRVQAPPLNGIQLSSQKEVRFYQATLTGLFDNAHTLLLDNKVVKNQVGYEIYTPLFVKDLNQFVLVDRGFTPINQNRDSLPTVAPIIGTQTITGLLNTAPRYVSLGDMKASNKITVPLRLEYIDLKKLSALFNLDFYPYILELPANDKLGFQIEWSAVLMPPEKHMGYAIQWFALALTLLILSLALGVGQRRVD